MLLGQQIENAQSTFICFWETMNLIIIIISIRISISIKLFQLLKSDPY